MSPHPSKNRRNPITGERDFRREAQADSRRERLNNVPITIMISIVGITTMILLVSTLRSGTSCSGEQTVKAYSGDSLNVLILSNVDGARNSEVSIEEIGYFITQEQPRLNQSLQVGETVRLPKSCSGNSFNSGWDRG